jgi:hypothetical protein
VDRPARRPLTMLWTREIGKHGSLHTHVLLHVPPWLMEDRKFYHEFLSELERSFEREGGPNHEQAIKVQPARTARSKLLYMLKGLDPRAAERFGVRTSRQGDFEGKRAGTTENIGPGARERPQPG